MVFGNIGGGFKDAALNVAGFATSTVAPAAQTAAHAVAGGAVAVADAATLGKIDELGKAKDDQFNKMHHHAENARIGWEHMIKKTPFFNSDPEPKHSGWMSELEDGVKITHLFIPGTHETMALHGGDIAMCQTWSLQDQLDAGVRAFDIRAKHQGDDLPIYHGVIYQKASFDDVARTMENFIASHPREVLFVRVRKEGTSGKHSQGFHEAVQSRFHSSCWHLELSQWTTLGAVRGRIILLAQGSAVRLYKQPIDLQDKWNCADHHEKARVILDHARKPRKDGVLYLSYCSACGTEGITFKTPASIALPVNQTVNDAVAAMRPGVYMMDYPGMQLVDGIIDRNRPHSRRARGGVDLNSAQAQAAQSRGCDIAEDPNVDIYGGGWVLVRHVPGPTWHPAQDKLLGTVEYGDANNRSFNSPQAWSKRFVDFPYDEMLFATVDGEQWLIASREEVFGVGDKGYTSRPRRLLQSSRPGKTATWSNRPGVPTEPLITLPGGQVLYQGASSGGNEDFLTSHGGVNVYVRTAAVDTCLDLDAGGWILVRHLPAGGSWAGGGLDGEAEFGDPDDMTFMSPTAWSMKFADIEFDQFLIASGDGAKWVIADRAASELARIEGCSEHVLEKSDGLADDDVLYCAAEASTLLEGWTHVRHVPSGSNWHPADDRMEGTSVYGDPSDDPTAAPWSINFEEAVGGWDQILFATGDRQLWLIATKEAVVGEYYSNELRDVQKSSCSPMATQVRWYRRTGCGEDPWISLEDHAMSGRTGTMLYGGNNHTLYTGSLRKHNGADVFIRKAPAMAAKCRNPGCKLKAHTVQNWPVCCWACAGGNHGPMCQHSPYESDVGGGDTAMFQEHCGVNVYVRSKEVVANMQKAMVELIGRFGVIPAGGSNCASQGCGFKEHSTQGTGYCCYACKNQPGQHGPLCEQQEAPPQVYKAGIGTRRFFLRTLHDEYVRGVPQSVGVFFDKYSPGDELAAELDQAEARVRDAQDRPREIRQLAQEWGCPVAEGDDLGEALQRNEQTRQRMSSAFRRADVDQNGKITKEELGMLFEKLGGQGFQCSPEAIDYILSRADKNGDGCSGAIDYEEFLDWLFLEADGL